MPVWKRTLWSTALAQMLCIVGFNFVLPFLPLFVQQLGVHGQTNITLWAGLLGGGSAICMAVSSPIWGVLADRHGRKIMLVRAVFSAAVLIGLSSLVQNVYELLALRMLQGVFTGTVTASQALVSSQVPKERLGFSLGVMQTAVYLGSSLGPLGGGLVADALGFRFSFAMAGCILLIAGVLITFLVEEEKRPVREVSAARQSFWRGMGDAINSSAVLAMAAAMFAVNFGVTVVFPILPQFVQMLQGPGGHDAALTGLVFTAAGVAGAISSVVTGSFADRIGYQRVIVTAAIIAAILSVPQYFVNATWQLAVLRILIGLALGDSAQRERPNCFPGAPRKARHCIRADGQCHLPWFRCWTAHRGWSRCGGGHSGSLPHRGRAVSLYRPLGREYGARAHGGSIGGRAAAPGTGAADARGRGSGAWRPDRSGFRLSPFLDALGRPL